MSVKPQPDSDKCGQEDTPCEKCRHHPASCGPGIGESSCQSQSRACGPYARWLGHQEGRVERDAEVLALIDDAMRGFGTQEKADTLVALRKAIKGE